MHWKKSRFRKEYSKIKFDTVSLCDNVKMAKAKDERAVAGKKRGGFFYGKEGGMMPRKPKHPCSYPGYPKLTDKRFCEKHEKPSNCNYEKYGRDKETKRRYGRAWKRIRDKYAAGHPFCEMYFERGIIVPTKEIHHKLPLSEGGTHDRSNLIALCKSCHGAIHAKRGDYWGNRRG